MGEAGTRQSLKQLLKEKLIEVQRKKYCKQLDRKTVTYDAWIRKQERKLREDVLHNDGSQFIIKRVPYEVCESYLRGSELTKEKADVILFLDSEGEEAELAEYYITEFMRMHPESEMVYGDEDVRSPEGIRYTPWLKPDWSPDTFLSDFYFGSVFAVRPRTLRKLSKEQIKMLWQDIQGDDRIGIYRMCYEIAKISGGFTQRTEEMAACSDFPIGHIDEILFHSSYNKDMNLLTGKPVLLVEEAEESNKQSPLISIIIPSKDNEEILKCCIESVISTASMDYEIIVVDNGSKEEARQFISGYLGDKNCVYLYEEMPFHFSRMCNRGAAAAKGEVLLFLNDDVEIPESQKEWMGKLYRQATKPYAGAIGVKLFYPETDKIQHAGIVNLRLGPVHKLQFKEDNIGYYFNFNKGMRNVIAVTGACLAIETKKFLQIKGFPEELAVAFNDVDLCFSLYELGYYNTMIQDTFFYHYESLSRGQDEEEEKLNRLLTEKGKLYKRHPALYGTDPFYHKYLANDMLSSGFDLKSDYEYTEDISSSPVENGNKLLHGAREDACVMVSLEYAGDLKEWEYGEVRAKETEDASPGYYIQGYAFVTGSDNACFEKVIILKDMSLKDEPFLFIKPETLIRKDVEQNLPDQINVGMTGFRAKICRKDLAAGNYRIGILMKDKCSRQKLYVWTNRYLEVSNKRG